MSHDHNACCCGGGPGTGHLVDCPLTAPHVKLDHFDDPARRRHPARGWLRRSIEQAKADLMRESGSIRLLRAARMVFDVRPTNWADDEDPDQVAAWSALEEALRASGGLS